MSRKLQPSVSPSCTWATNIQYVKVVAFTNSGTRAKQPIRSYKQTSLSIENTSCSEASSSFIIAVPRNLPSRIPHITTRDFQPEIGSNSSGSQLFLSLFDPVTLFAFCHHGACQRRRQTRVSERRKGALLPWRVALRSEDPRCAEAGSQGQIEPFRIPSALQRLEEYVSPVFTSV